MNTQSLNRAIGLAMSALQQARANNSNPQVVYWLLSAIKWLNKARADLKRGMSITAKVSASFAYEDICLAIAAR